MSEPLRSVRGTHDWLADETAQYRLIVDAARHAASCYGFDEVMTPIFEFSEVFHRTLGDSSDVVNKETYSFEDRGGESLTLRPELTASVVRAFISNALQDHLPFKAFYHGPVFRYERPQKGRMRQFHQLGIELLGAPEVQADVEVIALAYEMLQKLGVAQAVRLEINSLGDSASRAAYRSALVAYLSQHQAALSAESQMRLVKNPLRILDSKDEGDRALIAEAPRMHAFFNQASEEFFAALKAGLEALAIPYQVNDRLVRGLDYYNHTVFECITDRLGAQGTVLAGGRYDGLVRLMGGSDIAGIGFAAGIERLLALRSDLGCHAATSPQPVAMIAMGDLAEREALTCVKQLRSQGFRIEHITKGNMSKRLKKADKLNAKAVLILGEDECAGGVIALRDLRSGAQQQIALTALADALEAYRT